MSCPDCGIVSWRPCFPQTSHLRLFSAYNQNLKMAPGAPGTVTMILCDNASTIAQKLKVAAINAVLLEADSLVGLTIGAKKRVQLALVIAGHIEEVGPSR